MFETAAGSLRSWLEWTDSKQNFLITPRKEISRWLLHQNTNNSVVALYWGRIALWYGRKGVCDQYYGISSGISELTFCYKCMFLAQLLRFQDNDTKEPRLSASEFCLTTNLGIALAMTNHLPVLQRLSNSIATNESYKGYSDFPLSVYTSCLVELAANPQTILTDLIYKLKMRESLLIHPYLRFLNHLQSEDGFAVALTDICNYHIQQCKEHTNNRTYDFDEKMFQLYPAEVIAGLQLRKKSGLRIPESNHVLMKLPAIESMFAEEKVSVHDELYERSLKKVSYDF